ncbi:MAG: gamma-glutamyl-gamma-aminobutyrate hydrolase family protein [Gemmataceae bacterium]
MAFSARPVVGINVDLVAATKQTASYIRLAAGYFDSVYAAGGLPLVLPPLNKGDELDALLDKCDGVVMGGGLDLDPRRSNLPTHNAVVPMAARREESDRLLLRRVLDRKMPLLAIGVGMQQLNVMQGGSLFLHLPEEMPKSLPHFDPTGGPHRHIVLLEPKTRVDDIYGGGEIRVNSAHHQAVKALGAGLKISAKSPDEVIEAIESTDPRWFCVGVQWHPESDTASALDMQLFEGFVQAAAKMTQPLSLVA